VCRKTLFLFIPTLYNQDAAHLDIDEETILLAKQYDSSALYAIGLKYLEVKKNKLALSWLEKADEQSNAAAQFQIAQMYNKGVGVQPNIELATEYLTKAASNGNLEAHNILGEFCRDGIGMKPNEAKAVNWFKGAANSDCTNDIYNLGQMYERGVETGRKDPEKAFELYLQAAEMGHGAAKESVANFYRFGLGGVAVDLGKALKWYEKSANENNNSNAMYIIGDTVLQNYASKQLAADWFKKSADGGHKLASRSLEMLEMEGFQPRPIENALGKCKCVYINYGSFMYIHRLDDFPSAAAPRGMDFIALSKVPSEGGNTCQIANTTYSIPEAARNQSQNQLGTQYQPAKYGHGLSRKQIKNKQREQYKIMIQKLLEEPSIDLAQQVRDVMNEIQSE
jgi:TPR repeat protein